MWKYKGRDDCCNMISFAEVSDNRVVVQLVYMYMHKICYIRYV